MKSPMRYFRCVALLTFSLYVGHPSRPASAQCETSKRFINSTYIKKFSGFRSLGIFRAQRFVSEKIQYNESILLSKFEVENEPFFIYFFNKD